jgi:hypothetical protein
MLAPVYKITECHITDDFNLFCMGFMLTFVVVVALNIKITVSWDVTPYSLVNRYHNFDYKDGDSRLLRNTVLSFRINCFTSQRNLSVRLEILTFVNIKMTVFRV